MDVEQRPAKVPREKCPDQQRAFCLKVQNQVKCLRVVGYANCMQQSSHFFSFVFMRRALQCGQKFGHVLLLPPPELETCQVLQGHMVMSSSLFAFIFEWSSVYRDFILLVRFYVSLKTRLMRKNQKLMKIGINPRHSSLW